MNQTDERKLRQNWEIIKQEINVDEMVGKFVSLGVFTTVQRDAIIGPNSKSPETKSQKFLEAVLNGGNKTYQIFCNVVLENAKNPRNQTIIKVLGIELPYILDTGIAECGRQMTSSSIVSTSSSLSLSLGACAENLAGDKDPQRMVSARAPWRETLPYRENSQDNEFKDLGEENYRPSTPADAVHKAIEMASDTKSGELDMEALEMELVKIAPTIADLFSKIQKQTTTVTATSEEELQKVKEDNDRLRKTNRSLVEKLNSFQQKIIQLQLENKKLREINENEKIKQSQLEQRSCELENLKYKLLEQKRALEEKEKELDLQMEKLQTVINDNEEQKLKLANLQQLHEEGLREYEEQQMQIEELQRQKEQQKEKILALEEKQRMSEELLYRFEERLLLLEKGGAKKSRQRFGIGKPWMNGMVERSHHVHVKLQPQFPTDWSSGSTNNPNGKGGKGWFF